jgi:subtilase family serine protease
MTQSTSASPLRRSFSLILLLIAAAALLSQSCLAQLSNRISPDLRTTDAAPLKGSLHPLARPAFDRGRVAGSTKVPYMTLIFAPSAEQKAALTALLAAQQNPASPSYHKWLTPAQFAAQFGMSAQDIASTEAWLQAQGFAVLDVAPSGNAIHFSGTAAQVESAFHTEMHQYLVNGVTHLANSTELSLPTSLAGAVAGVRGVAGFRPHAMHTPVRHPVADAVKPAYTSSVSGNHYIAPDDITTIYDIKALYNAGLTGTGQSIAIVGQSAISTTDIDAFRTAAGLPLKEPTMVLVPNTGVSTIQSSSGDEDESDIDLEWSGAIAENATITFVYVGDSENSSVLDALTYAIQNSIAPVISVSYGACELDSSSDAASLEPVFMEANAQGETILASAGDSGATGCEAEGATSATLGLAVNYPSSSAYVTAMGGTQFNEGSATYWNTTNDSLAGSAISYIPEEAWNETAASNALNPPGGLSSTGGGASVLFGKPSWQVATNVPDDGARDVPDISLDAAGIHDGFLYCTEGSCTSGFRNTASGLLTVAGGTSFDAPIFAAILSLINERNASAGAGNINTQLYPLFSSAPTAFHDITVGNNEQPCSSGSIDCPAGTTQIGFATGAGYDEVTGLGSIDAYNLALAFPAINVITTGSLVASATTLSASTSAPVTGAAVTFTAAVTPASGTVPAGTAAPSGTVNFVVDGGTAVPVTLANGTAAYPVTFTTTGAHTVIATYAGDSNYATSTASSAITVASSTTTGSFTIAATNVTVASGSSVNSTVTITGSSGYTGVVGLTYSSPAGFTGCLFANDVGVGLNGTVATSITVDTLASDCQNTGVRRQIARSASHTSAATDNNQKPPARDREYPIAAAAALAGLVLLGRKRKAWPVAMVLMLAGLGVLSGCGGNSGSSVVGTTSTTYTINLTGTDTAHSSITASTTFTVTVQ